MQTNPGCCMVCGKRVKSPTGVDIALRIAGADSWPFTWYLLCEKHGREVYEAATRAACEKVNETKEAGEWVNW